jgi:hypothetical protein
VSPTNSQTVFPLLPALGLHRPLAARSGRLLGAPAWREDPIDDFDRRACSEVFNG